jgi:hypothetical protein
MAGLTKRQRQDIADARRRLGIDDLRQTYDIDLHWHSLCAWHRDEHRKQAYLAYLARRRRSPR